eukprot:774172-Pleurochrysis_carterae.AAC.1
MGEFMGLTTVASEVSPLSVCTSHRRKTILDRCESIETPSTKGHQNALVLYVSCVHERAH